jgi:hypothetical protein
MLTAIVSGGQTGADRAALDVALAWGLECGGWVPSGRLAEDGRIPAHYPNLRETSSRDAAVRTRRNVRDADGTLIISHRPLGGGSLLTLQTAERLGRPVLHIDLARVAVHDAVRRTARWISDRGIRRLNVAGPRASGDPGIHDATLLVLGGALAMLECSTELARGPEPEVRGAG